MTADDLRAFEAAVKAEMVAGTITGPVHLSGGNEDQLIEIFRDVKRDDWVFSTYRSHYHALLHGMKPDWLMHEIRSGRSIGIQSPYHRFYTSAIVGGCAPIAVGVAAAIKRNGGSERVWCFVGDMAASIGSFRDAHNFAVCNDLNIRFVIEDNGFSTNTPTAEAWGTHVIRTDSVWCRGYTYTRTEAHYGADRKASL